MFSGLPLHSTPLASNHTKGWLWLLPCVRLKDRARCVQALQCVLLFFRPLVVAPCRCTSDHAIEAADQMGGVRWRAGRLLINCYVDWARAGIRIDILYLRV